MTVSLTINKLTMRPVD